MLIPRQSHGFRFLDVVSVHYQRGCWRRSGISCKCLLCKSYWSEMIRKRSNWSIRMQDEIRGRLGWCFDWILTLIMPDGSLETQENQKWLYISMAKRIDWAHDNKYVNTFCVSQANWIAYIKELWEYLQSIQQYKAKLAMYHYCWSGGA